jgi:fluoride ion exporter CrcB/FEX
MIERGDILPAMVYVVVSVAGGFFGLWLALLLMRQGVAP